MIQSTGNGFIDEPVSGDPAGCPTSAVVCIAPVLALVSSIIELSCCQFSRNLAEGEGFEPPEACASTVFKTAAFDHSATPPVWGWF